MSSMAALSSVVCNQCVCALIVSPLSWKRYVSAYSLVAKGTPGQLIPLSVHLLNNTYCSSVVSLFAWQERLLTQFMLRIMYSSNSNFEPPAMARKGVKL